ncbi:hypothetical protein SRB17_85940 [Streptomyces sp. RB17]|nr:hypothetical protein [Streptomyces sp. RB17]
MTRCAGWQGTGFACMVTGMQEPLDAARSVCAVASMTLDPAERNGWGRAAGDVPRGGRR